MVLTDRQKVDLHRAILEYLSSEENSNTFSKTIEAFCEECNIQEADTKDFGKNLLEKKWTSVIRLQKRVMDLEAQINELQRNGGRLPGISESSGSGGIDANNRMLPKAPAKSSIGGHRGPILAIAAHPVFSLVASGSEDSTIKLWDYETSQYERTLKGHTGSVTGVAFSPLSSNMNPSSVLLASCSADMSAKLWDLTTFTCIKTLKGHDHTLSAVAFLPSGDYLLTCSRDKLIKAWEISTGYCIRTYTGHNEWIKCISVSMDGVHIASGGTDHTIMIWKFATGACEQTLRGHEHVVECLSFGKRTISLGESNGNIDVVSANDVSLLVSGSRDRSVRLWDTTKGICLMVFNSHDNWVRSVFIHPSGKHIVSCSDDKSIRVFDIKEGRCIRTIADAHSHFVTCMTLSCVHPVLISGSVDKNISIWGCS